MSSAKWRPFVSELKSRPISTENDRHVNIQQTHKSKVFERSNSNQLSPYLEDIFLIYAIKYYRRLEIGNSVGIIALDLSKAFDSLSHGLHAAKLFVYGVVLAFFYISIYYICFIDNDVTIYNYAHNNIDIIKSVLESDVKHGWIG